MVPLNSPVSGSTTEYILELLAASTASLQRVASRSCRARSATRVAQIKKVFVLMTYFVLSDH